MSNVRCAMFGERTVLCRLVPAAKVRVDLPRAVHNLGMQMPRNPSPGRSTMIFMIPKTKKPGGSKQGSTGNFRTQVQPSSQLLSPLPPLVSSRLACHVFDSTAGRHDCSFSHILPVLGWHQFHARSHPISPIVVGGNATSHLVHVFVMNYQRPHTSLRVSSGLYLVA